MRVFKIERNYRTFGIGYGLPYFTVEFGFGTTYKPEDLLRKLGEKGLDVGHWILLTGGPIKEQGAGVFIQGLRYCKANVEIEESGNSRVPGWFNEPNRWIIDWVEGGSFNYAALRPRQDILVYREGSLEVFLKEVESYPCLKVIIHEDPSSIWDLVMNKEIRVYRS